MSHVNDAYVLFCQHSRLPHRSDQVLDRLESFHKLNFPTLELARRMLTLGLPRVKLLIRTEVALEVITESRRLQ